MMLVKLAGDISSSLYRRQSFIISAYFPEQRLKSVGTMKHIKRSCILSFLLLNEMERSIETETQSFIIMMKTKISAKPTNIYLELHMEDHESQKLILFVT